MLNLRRFQKRFLRAALVPSVDTAALSIPRGNGKSALAGHLCERILTPADPLFRPGTESVLISGSIEQCRIVFGFARAALEGTGEYRFLDSATRCAITHKATRTRLRVHGSNARTAQGFVNVPFVVWDEPGSAETRGGELLWDAVSTAQGKPGSPLRAVLIGTLAPATGGWWHDLVADGSRRSVHVTALQGDRGRWDQWPEIRRCNPLSNIDAAFRRKLLEERDAARRDSRLKARFLSYRMNAPTADESQVLLTVDDWRRVCARPVPSRAGRPIVGLDLGAGRAWSAAVAAWRNGRVEAVAIAPGLPSIADQETRDRVPRGTYQRLVESGALRIAVGLRVPEVSDLLDAARARWGRFEVIFCDRFNLDKLRDAGPGCQIVPRVWRWSEGTEDIRALRKLALDGPLSCDPVSRSLLTASLSAAMVENDTSGNTRMVKRGSNNQARDDVSAALVLAAGALDRAPAPRRRRRMELVG